MADGTAIDGIRSKLQHFLGWNTKDQDKVAIKQRVRDFAPIVFFDFDFTLTVVHVFKSLAGWVDAQVCMLAMRGMVVSEPHALTERGQLRRLSELGPAWIEQAFGGFSRVTAIRKLLDGLINSGCQIVLVTRGYVGVARKCLQEVDLLGKFDALYGNIGVAYGTRTAYDIETEQNVTGLSEEVDRLWSLLGKWKEGDWDSKTEIVHRYQHQYMLTREQVLFVDDDSQELAPLRHSALTVHAKGNGMGERDMMDILDLLGLQQEAWASDCYDYWHALRDPLASKPFAITIFNRKHIPIRASRHIAMLEAEFAGRKSSLRRFTLLMREPLLFLSIAQQAYVKHVSLTGDTQFSLKSLAPVIQGVEEHFGVGGLLWERSDASFGSFGDLQLLRGKSPEVESVTSNGNGKVAMPVVSELDEQAEVPGVPASATGNHLYEEPLSKHRPEEPVKTLTSLVRMFQQTLLGLCPITLATAGRHRNTICCHEVQSSPEEAVWCRYQKKKHIGAGHFGEVFQANELCTGRPVAVKHLERLDPEEEGQGDEVSVLRALAHPNLLRIFEVVKFPGEVLIVTELAEQGSLSTFAAAAAAGSQPEGAPWIAGAMQQILSAVAYCHRQFVLHGDLKPENVLIGGSRPDGSPLCIVCDFGHATVCLGSELVAAPGDPRYIAPEVIAKEHLCTRSDVYMLGVTAFELLTGGWLPFFNLKAASLPMCYQQLSRGGVHERILSEKGLDWRDQERLRIACKPEVQSVVLGMMARNAQDRPEAVEVLRTSWLQDAHGPCKSAYDAMLKADANNGWGLWVPQHPLFAKRLEKRAGLSWTYRMLLSLIGSGLQSKELLGARLLFRRMDEGGNGQLNKKQFCKAAMAAGLDQEVSEALFVAGDLHSQSYLDFKNTVMLFLDLDALSDDELLSELRSLLTRILGPSSCHPATGQVDGTHGTPGTPGADAFRLSDLQSMLHARPDARMERWVKNLKNGLGPGDHVFTAELLLSVLQNDCFDKFPPTSGP